MHIRYITAFALFLLTLPGVVIAGTIQNFDSAGTPFVGQNIAGLGGHPNSAAAPTVLGGGPSGNFLQLKDSTIRTFNTVGFDRSDVGPHAQVSGQFDFRMTCRGNRVGFGSGGCADGFSMMLLDTGIFGTIGQVDTGGNKVTLDEAARAGNLPSGVTSGSFGIGFAVFDNGGGTGPQNRVFLSFNDISFSSVLISRAVLDLATGTGGQRAGFLTASFDLLLDSLLPTISVSLTNGTTTVTPYSNFDLSGVTGLAPYESRVGFGTRSGDAGVSTDLDNINITFTPVAASDVPEPPVLALFGLGLAGLGISRRKRKQHI